MFLKLFIGLLLDTSGLKFITRVSTKAGGGGATADCWYSRMKVDKSIPSTQKLKSQNQSNGSKDTAILKLDSFTQNFCYCLPSPRPQPIHLMIVAACLCMCSRLLQILWTTDLIPYLFQ